MCLNILDLNDDCLACIVRNLPIDSHLKFAKVCRRFRHIWLDNKKTLYKKIELGRTSEENLRNELVLLCHIKFNVKHIIINLNRNFLWKDIFTKRIQDLLCEMYRLERVLLWIKDEEPHNVFEGMLRSLENLPNLKCMATYKDGAAVDCLHRFSSFEKILEESRMSRSLLMETKASPTKLRLLVLKNASLEPTLTDLVLHSTGIHKLRFGLLDNADQYRPLTQLPHLRVLNIDCGCQDIMPLISAVSARLSNQLQSLTIFKLGGLGYRETLEIIKISSLEKFHCYFNDVQCLELLINLNKLKDIDLQLPPTGDLDKPILSLLENCRDLQVLQMKSPKLSASFLGEAFKILKEVRNSDKQQALILLFGLSQVELDEDVSRYLKMFVEDDDS